MALVKGTNSYNTSAEANLYFANRLDVAAWTAASEANTDAALVTATSVLDLQTWAGYAVSESQLLAQPRTGTYYEPKLGRTIELDSVMATTRVSSALYELAYHLLNNDGLLDDVGRVDSLSISGISLTKVSGASLLPPIVRSLIKPLLVNGGANLWWRAN